MFPSEPRKTYLPPSLPSLPSSRRWNKAKMSKHGRTPARPSGMNLSRFAR